MPHKCVRCDKIFPDNAPELIIGCPCGAKIFLYLKDIREAMKVGHVQWIEEELKGIMKKREGTISLEVENIRMLQKGVFEIDLQSLLENPVVVKDQKGIFYIKLPEKQSSILISPKNNSK